MPLIPAKMIGGALQISDVETGATARVPGEVDNGQAAVTDRDVLDALHAIGEKLDAILLKITEETEG